MPAKPCNLKSTRKYHTVLVTSQNPPANATKEQFLQAIAKACKQNCPLGPNLFVVRERNKRPGKNHHVCADGNCYHMHAVLHWPDKPRALNGIANRLIREWGTPRGELQFDYFAVPNKAGHAAGRAIGLAYFTEPGKDKIIDPDGPLFFSPPAFGTKEWARIEVMKPRPTRWGHTIEPAIIGIRETYGSFEKWWEHHEKNMR